MNGTSWRLALAGLIAAAVSPLQAQTKPAAGLDELPVPLCTAGILASKDGEAALGLYELGNDQTMIEWVDGETAAKSCAKAVPGGLRLTVDNVSLGLAQVGSTPLFTYDFGAPRQFQTALLEPALCESYAGVGSSPLSLSVRDTNGETKVLYGVESLRYSLSSGGLAPELTQGDGPLLRCHAVTDANVPLPETGGLFRGDFESSANLRVEFLDVQGARLNVTGLADQFINQPLAAVNGITYKVLVTNDGDGPAVGVRVREFVPKASGSVSPSIQTVGCGAAPQGTETYCAGGNGALTHNLGTLQPGASQVYTLTRKAAGTGARTAVAVFSDPTSDGDQLIADNSRSLTINLVANQAPLPVGTLANVVLNEGSVVSIATAGAFSDPDGNTLTYSATGLPAGIAINQTTGAIGGNLGFTSNGVYNVVVTANDGSLTAQQAFTLTVTNQNGAPIAVGTLPNVQFAEGALLEIQTAGGFSDPDGDVLVYSANGLPPGIIFSPTTGLAIGQLSNASAGVYDVTITASDTALSVDQSFTLTVTNVNNAPTVAVAIDDQANEEGEAISLDIAGNFDDADAGDSLTFSVTGGSLPTGLSLSANGTITGVIAYTASVGSPYSVTITADDGNSGTVSDTFSWTVSDENGAPQTEEELTDVVVAEGALLDKQTALGFSDPDGDVLTYAITGLPAGVIHNPATGQIFGVPAGGSADEYEITVTASDGNLTAEQTFTLTVTAP
ncbi:putative Ig domain-containing protein [Chiayiivirga flava]|uniref:Dystroglycan-type cadherin-like domain-containing protein n=1 Tax=Chiayiivirga flava TaxID=659595 RepID=A0A7W8FYF4_9GAMM|nr:putative Ig domain-containing protein [Chiayiivirga flava]MBB5207051.1 hypothetical protein [Chiayiivirga flava]